MYLVVVDATVWVKYARAKNIAPLIDRLVAYNLVPVVNYYLLSEIFEAVLKNRWMTEKQAITIIDYIRRIALVTAERAIFRLSPDPKDNYLFDLAIQNNAAFILSDDSRLLAMKHQPRMVLSSNRFIKHFPL
jgi:putative PIN family toxin of toxin-antitoxin system